MNYKIFKTKLRAGLKQIRLSNKKRQMLKLIPTLRPLESKNIQNLLLLLDTPDLSGLDIGEAKTKVVEGKK